MAVGCTVASRRRKKKKQSTKLSRGCVGCVSVVGWSSASFRIANVALNQRLLCLAKLLSSGAAILQLFLSASIPLLYRLPVFPTMSKRTSYTADFKRRVILFAESSNNCAAQRKFDVNEKLIRGWRKQRDNLFACSGQRRAFRGPTTGRHDILEKELRLHVN